MGDINYLSLYNIFSVLTDKNGIEVEEHHIVGGTESPKVTGKYLPVRYDANLFRATPEIPPWSSRWLSRTEWSMVSKAVLRSLRTRAEQCPESAANRRSSLTLGRAVSVL